VSARGPGSRNMGLTAEVTVTVTPLKAWTVSQPSRQQRNFVAHQYGTRNLRSYSLEERAVSRLHRSSPDERSQLGVAFQNEAPTKCQEAVRVNRVHHRAQERAEATEGAVWHCLLVRNVSRPFSSIRPEAIQQLYVVQVAARLKHTHKSASTRRKMHT
jgi:hypothetical protein